MSESAGAREFMNYDVVIVGAGPAGLGCAIRLKQLERQTGREISVCVLEKGAEVGAHILSGAVLEPRALDELLPDWKEQGAPVTTPAAEDRFLFLTAGRAWRLPTPPQMRNEGNYIISLGNLCRWLAAQAEAMGVEIYPGFAAAEILYDASGAVRGVATGDMGLNRDGTPGPSHQPGMELHARQTVFAEGCRGHLGKQLMARFGLRQGRDHQTYGLGLKEVWEIDPARSKPGLVVHSVGWPLDSRTYGGSFLYHLEGNLVSLGFVVGLDYDNPHLSPYQEFQRFKHHPAIAAHLAGGRRIAYGARALNEGGFQSVPKLTFPGGLLAGCEAGFLNTPKIKGSHTAMKSGMLAAETLFPALTGADAAPVELTAYEDAVRTSWIWPELKQARNIRPAFRWGLWPAMLWAAVDTYVFRGRAPWTLRHHRPDHACLKNRHQAKPPVYPKPDGVLSFDRLTNLAFSGTNHTENQPCHLQLAEPGRALSVNLADYDAPEQRYCPAGVYEIVETDGRPRLQINAQNCLHCKSCDIKDPTGNITWVSPQGGEGPAYQGM